MTIEKGVQGGRVAVEAEIETGTVGGTRMIAGAAEVVVQVLITQKAEVEAVMMMSAGVEVDR